MLYDGGPRHGRNKRSDGIDGTLRRLLAWLSVPFPLLESRPLHWRLTIGYRPCRSLLSHRSSGQLPRHFTEALPAISFSGSFPLISIGWAVNGHGSALLKNERLSLELVL